MKKKNPSQKKRKATCFIPDDFLDDFGKWWSENLKNDAAECIVGWKKNLKILLMAGPWLPGKNDGAKNFRCRLFGGKEAKLEAVLSDEQRSNGCPFSLLNDEQRVATRWGWFAPTSKAKGTNWIHRFPCSTMFAVTWGHGPHRKENLLQPPYVVMVPTAIPAASLGAQVSSTKRLLEKNLGEDTLVCLSWFVTFYHCKSPLNHHLGKSNKQI